ncbi:MAG: hypothetical protein MZV70_64900 [Desulfobacterales bacterium]|nr:hypothetical protein [Desulfobacterales bacterium]
MNQQTSEQEWYQLTCRIRGMLDSFLKEDILAIEHKSNVTALLSAPPEYMNSMNMENAE